MESKLKMIRGYRRSQSLNDFTVAKLSIIDNLLEKGVNYLKNSKTMTFGKDKKNLVEEETEDLLWPNCDTSIWLRTCNKEVIEPIPGLVSGRVPLWLKGTLLRNGPGSLKVGNYEFNHIFDGSALLHKFKIKYGKVTYQRRFVQTEVYKKNHTAQRIVVTEFGTKAVPDPCQSIFHRVSSIFRPNDNLSDNSMISIYPFGDEFYTFTESPIIHRIDIKTLETMDKVNLMDRVSIVNHTSHPHVMNDGTVYNVGMTVSSRGPAYNVIAFPPNRNDSKQSKTMFDEAKIVATVPSRWILNPSYMHTFGITDNYFIIIEQPLAVSLVSSVTSQITKDPMCSCLKWHENENTLIHVISRETGQVEKTFIAEAFFYLHIINQYETQDKNHIVLDICCYKNSRMLDCMYIENLKNIHRNPEYPKLFRGRPLRFILPLNTTDDEFFIEENLIDENLITHSSQPSESSVYHRSASFNTRREMFDVLHKKASAHRLPNGDVFVKPELLCDMGCETPRINNDLHVGKEYRYFYAISSDVDLDNPGTIIKVDTLTKTKKIWCERQAFPSEPIFVRSPNAIKEDDGVILSALVWGQDRETEVGLLILDAATFTEIARVTFSTPGPVPKCLHGWFSMEK